MHTRNFCVHEARFKRVLSADSFKAPNELFILKTSGLYNCHFTMPYLKLGYKGERQRPLND